MSTGYSGTPLIQKLGIRQGYRVCVINQPDNYVELLGDLPSNVFVSPLDDGEFDFIHAFYLSAVDLREQFAELKAALKSDGILWISWVKKASKVETDLNREIVRETGLSGGLVDVKVGAIDATWSGLKFVYRTKDR
ncbi:MAG: DUF3052 family protein [Anaerolineae bacterium]